MDQAIRKVWLGEAPLATAFWLYGVGGNILVSVLVAALAAVVFLISAGGARASIVVSGVLQLAALAYMVLSMVGIWRSAGRYPGNPFFAVLARIVVAIGVLWSVLAVLGALAFVLGMHALPSIIAFMFSGTR